MINNKNGRSKFLDKLREEVELDEHLISISELCTRFGTDSVKGLNCNDAYILLQKYGKNILAQPSAKSNLYLFIENMSGWFNLLLWFGSFLCFITSYFEGQLESDRASVNNTFLGIILASVVIITGIFSFSQQRKSCKIMDSFKNLLPVHVNVIRDGIRNQILVEDLVIGDLVEIKAGDQVPADIRLVTNNFLKVDNSSLTGESEPLLRSLSAEHNNPLEAKNLIFFSTNCLEGSATGIVIRTGNFTTIGKIAILATGIDHEITPLSNDIRIFIMKISIIAIIFAIIFFVICINTGFNFLESMIYFITIIVANVPEGLLPTLTLALTLTAKRMALRNCLVKNIQAVETLGSTSVICTDKTGTLTQNKMTVSHLWYNDKIYKANELIEYKIIKNNLTFWEPIIRNAAICSKSEFLPNQEDISIQNKKALGDPSEIAILKFLETSFDNVQNYRKQFLKIFELPFNSNNKFSMMIIADNQNKKYLLMKGASEQIIEKCNTILINGKDVELTKTIAEKYENVYLKFGGYGERVIGFCDKILDKFDRTEDESLVFEDERIPKSGYRFLGLISMIDPPRPTVPHAVKECRSAGIKIIMVTGDHPITAYAIAKSIGIISTETREEVAIKQNVDINEINPDQAGAVVITGEQLKKMSESELHDILKFQEIIFARTSPQQKLAIVEGCQKLGFIVAVTGDGVNDSPALKKANIGIAMGITGSDVSKQAADIILLDDNFSSIVIGIEEGRTIFDNLKKSVCYTLSSKLPQMAPFLAFVLFNIPLGMCTITILCIDLGTDIIPSVSLAYEPPESDIMRRAPRNVKKDGLVNYKLISVSYLQFGLIQICAGFYAYFVILSNNGYLPKIVYGIRKQWDSKIVNDLEDSYKQEWTYEQRKTLEITLYTVFFIAIILVKVFTLIACKTRKLSIFQHGFANKALNISIIVELLLTIIITQTPSLNDKLQMYPLPIKFWFYSIPFAFLLFVYDEIRRFLIRNFPRGFFFNETYY